MGEIRNPIKKSSIEKKNKILEKGFTLMCEKGYHNVNSVDIAKYAGVSTGIIYQYFTDKRDIFIEGVKNYSSNIMFPMIDILDNTKIDKNNLEIDEKNNLFGLIGTLKEEDFKSLLIEAINPVGYNMIVTPKEIDFVIDRLANVISTGINNALHDKVTHLKV